MIKKIDGYILKTFFGPFAFIFSILFFIFIVQFAWQELDKFVGKGLPWYTIAQLLLYLGVNVIQLVLPLTILLGSIMTFGGFGERYELAAIKSTGISLIRTMAPLFIVVCIMSVGLFFFADRVMPFSQKKAKNMLYNIARTKPTLQFQEGIFIEGIPEYSMKVDQISGDNGEFLKNIFISKNAGANENRQTIIADSGVLKEAPEDKHYLKMLLQSGIMYEDQVRGKNPKAKRGQPMQVIAFDTLAIYFDISELLDKAVNQENIQNNYRFLNTKALSERIDTVRMQVAEKYTSISQENLDGFVYAARNMDSLKVDSIKELPWNYSELSLLEKNRIVEAAIKDLGTLKSNYKRNEDEIKANIKGQSRHIIHYQRNFAYALTCIIFFLVGSPLGAIVKKGGVGMPVVVSIVVFLVYYIITLSMENMSKNGNMEPNTAAWLANLIFLPFAVFLTIKANNDSALFSSANYVEKYFKPLIKKLGLEEVEEKKEHDRYQ